VLDDLRVTPDDELMERRVGDLARVALVVMKHVTSEHLLEQLARLHAEITRLLATEQGRIGFSGILWYIESAHPTLGQLDILSHLRPVVGPEITKTMESYEETLERMVIEKHKRLARKELLLQQLAWRFGEVPGAVTERVNQANGCLPRRRLRRILTRDASLTRG
jgi:hypothetical protein